MNMGAVGQKSILDGTSGGKGCVFPGKTQVFIRIQKMGKTNRKGDERFLIEK